MRCNMKESKPEIKVCDFFINKIENIKKQNYNEQVIKTWEFTYDRERKTDRLIYILGGEAMLCPGDKKFHVKTGDIVHRPLHLPYTAYGIKGPFFYIDISFIGDTKNAVLDTLIHDENQYFLKKFETIYTKWNNKNGQYILECKSLIHALMAELITERDYMTLSDKKYEILSKAISYIEINISNPYFSIGELLKYLNIGDTYFRKIFKERYGMTTIKYINELRISKAKDYLLNSDINIVKIAEATGFLDVYYFSNSFKSSTGLSPSLYRKKKRPDKY